MSIELGDSLDFAKNQALNLRLQNLLSAYPAGANTAGIIYFNETNNLAYYINNGGTEVPIGGVVNAYTSFVDGTNTASASGATAFKFRSANNKLSVVVTNNDATHGDNLLLTVNEANLDHGSFGGLNDDDHPLYAAKDGRTGGQEIIGGTAASESLVLSSTSHATKGRIDIGDHIEVTDDTGRTRFSAGWGDFYITPANLGTANNLLEIWTDANPSTRFGVSGLGNIWSIGTVTGNQLVSQVASGTAPLVVSSNTLVNNLNADQLDSQQGSYYLARGNHTGTALANTISNFDTQVRTSRLDQMTAPTVTVSMNSQRLSNVASPTSDTDAANKLYVDTAVQGLDIHPSIRIASLTNVSVTYNATGGTSARGQITGAPTTVDGVALANGDRIGLYGQTTGAQNGVWIATNAGTGLWDRAPDFDSSADVTTGAFMFVEAGTNAGNGYVLTSPNPVIVGGASSPTAMTFSQFSGAGQITAGAGMTKTGNTMDVIAGAGITVAADSVSVSAGLQAVNSAVVNGTPGILFVSSSNAVSVRPLAAGAGISLFSEDGSSGNPTIGVSTALANVNTQIASVSTGFLATTAANTAALRTLADGTGITWTNPAGVAGNPSAALTGQALALHNMATDGIFVRNGGSMVGRSLANGTGISITNANGTAGNPTVSIDTAWAGQTNITTLGTITTGTWNGTAIAATRGGTGQTTYTTGDLLVGGASNTLNKLADVATGNVLISGGVGVAPSYGKVGLTTHVSGVLPAANGGTGVNTFGGVNTLLYTTAANTISHVATTPNGFVVTNGSSVPTVSSTVPGFKSMGAVTLGSTTPGISPHLSIIDEADVSPRGLAIQQHSTDKPPLLDMYRSRGSYASPASVINDDYVSAVFCSAYDGTAYRAVGAYGYRVGGSGEGSVSTNNIPGEWFWSASVADAPNPYANGTVRMRLKTNGDLIVSGNISAASITGTMNVSGISGVLPLANGGTGQSSFTAGDMMYYSSGTSLSKLAAGANTQVLVGGTTPSWGAVNLANGMVTGTLTTDKGGTGLSGATPFTSANRLLLSSSGSVLTTLATGNNGVLVTNGSGVPSISSTLPAVNGAAVTSLTAGNLSGQVAIANGGTGVNTKAAARADTGLADTGKRLVQQFEVQIGNGSATTIDVVHNLGTTKINWNITRVSNGAQILTTGSAYDTNTLRLQFSTAPTTNSLNVLVTG